MDTPNDGSGLPDAANPRAVAYAHQQLRRMVKMGILPKSYGLPGEDITATYRRVSSVLGARRRALAIGQRNPGAASPIDINPGGPMQQGQQPQAAIGALEAAAVPAQLQGAVGHALPRPPGQHPQQASAQALLAALRPHRPGPVNPQQQLIAHLVQRVTAARGPYIQNF